MDNNFRKRIGMHTRNSINLSVNKKSPRRESLWGDFQCGAPGGARFLRVPVPNLPGGRKNFLAGQRLPFCKDRNVLKEYLESKEQEVVDIMMTLFDDEQILKAYAKDIEDTVVINGGTKRI